MNPNSAADCSPDNNIFNGTRFIPSFSLSAAVLHETNLYFKLRPLEDGHRSAAMGQSLAARCSITVARMACEDAAKVDYWNQACRKPPR
jgi:hypothetical protein